MIMLTRGILPASCGSTIQNGDAVVALSVPVMNNPANPNNNPICNKQISIHNPTTGTDTIATVVDTCQGCAFGNIDVMEDLFYKIAPNGDGRVHGIEWTPIGWTVPGGSDESATTQSSASPAVQPSPPATAASASEAVQNVGLQEKVAVVAPSAAAAPSVTSTPSAASSNAPAISPSVAPAMPSAAPTGSSSSCTTAGASVCSADGTQIGTCNVDLTVQMGPVAAGTKCENGYLVMASSRLRSRRG